MGNNRKRNTKKQPKGNSFFKKIGIAVLGLLGVAVLVNKELPEGNTTTQNTIEGKANENPIANDFTARVRVEESEQKNNSNIIKNIEQEVNSLHTKEEVLAYLKNMYIEEYEKETEDISLTIDDIKIRISSQNYVLIDENTGDIITHGELPELTIKALQENNIIYDVEYNKKTYSIENNGEIIDMATLENGVTIKVIPGNKYNEMKGYNSILEKLGGVIPAGISYAESLEKTNPTDMDKYKKEFIMTIEEFINTQQSGLTQNNQAEQQPNLTENNENNQIYPEY